VNPALGEDLGGILLSANIGKRKNRIYPFSDIFPFPVPASNGVFGVSRSHLRVWALGLVPRLGRGDGGHKQEPNVRRRWAGAGKINQVAGAPYVSLERRQRQVEIQPPRPMDNQRDGVAKLTNTQRPLL
jgi:hypothetical protein